METMKAPKNVNVIIEFSHLKNMVGMKSGWSVISYEGVIIFLIPISR